MSPRQRLREGWQVNLDNLIRITEAPSVEPQIEDHMSELNVEGHGEDNDNSNDQISKADKEKKKMKKMSLENEIPYRKNGFDSQISR